MWVIKLGGSLAAAKSLPQWLATIVEYGSARSVIVPGGGPFADAVRTAQQRWRFDDTKAHHMALLAMEQYALLLSGLCAGLVVADSMTAIRSQLAAGRVPVWLPTAMVLEDDAIEMSWRMSSDSLAAWLAQRLNAAGLLLIKSVSIAEAEIGLDRLVAQGIVDPLFGDYARRAGCTLYLLGPDAAERLSALSTGHLSGTLITC